MNYMTGFMLGTSLVQSVKSFLGGKPQANVKKPASNLVSRSTLRTFSESEEFGLEFRTPGRCRYRTQPINPALARLIEINLSKLDFIKTINVTPETGSILITFDEKDAAKIGRLAIWLKKHLFNAEDAEYRQDLKLNRVFYGGITRSIKSTLRHISKTIIRETNGLFDIRSLSSLIFFSLGLRKMLLTGQLPSGVQMIWWAVSLLRGVKIS